MHKLNKNPYEMKKCLHNFCKPKNRQEDKKSNHTINNVSCLTTQFAKTAKKYN